MSDEESKACATCVVLPFMYIIVTGLFAWLITWAWNAVVPNYLGWTTLTVRDTFIFIVLILGIGWVIGMATKGIRSRA